MTTAQTSLGASLLPADTPRAARAAILILAGVCLMTLGAKVQIPFWPVPVTLQTLALPLIAAAYGPRLAFFTMLAYLGAGIAGIPVFAGTPPGIAGPAYFLGGTGGYLVAYPIAAYVIGALSEGAANRSPVRLFAAMVAGGVIIFAMGFVWLAFFAQLASGATGLGAMTALEKGVVPFIIADLFKYALATAILIGGWMTLDRKKG